MKQNISAMQKLAGVMAAIIILLLVGMPVQAMLSSLLRNEASLQSQRGVIGALSARLSDDYAALQGAGQLSQTASEVADAETTALVLQDKCAVVADILAGDLVEPNCKVTQIALGGDLTLHQAQSAYSGDSEAVFKALDQLSGLEYPLIEFRVAASPSELTTLSVSFAGVGIASEEPQP